MAELRGTARCGSFEGVTERRRRILEILPLPVKSAGPSTNRTIPLRSDWPHIPAHLSASAENVGCEGGIPRPARLAALAAGATASIFLIGPGFEESLNLPESSEAPPATGQRS